MCEHAGCLEGNRRSHEDEVTHVAGAASDACRAGPDLDTCAGRAAGCATVFLGLRIEADLRVPAAMAEADRVALCDARSVADVGRRAVHSISSGECVGNFLIMATFQLK
jgi:hypothetical protein